MVNKMEPWFTFKDCFDITWKVFLVRGSHPVLEDKGAITLTDHNEIYVAEDGDPQKVLLLLGHEITHSCISGPADGPVNAKLFGVEEDKLEEQEELIVAHISNRLFSLLLKNLFLQFPKLP